MIAAVYQLETWSEFGLIGLVVGAMFGIFVFILRMNVKKDERHAKQIGTLTNEHTTFLREMMAEQKDERKDRDEKFVRSNDRLADAITGLRDEIAKRN